MACAVLLAAARGWAQGPAAYQDPIRYGDLGFRRSLAVTSSPSAPVPQERGVSFSDILRGNGAKAGYSLTHGGIVQNSECVTVDGSMLRRNQDYYLDPSSGMLLFSEAIRTTQTVRVTYRYSQEKDQQRSAIGAPNMSLDFGPSTSLGITFSQNVLNSSFDLLTYGANLKTNLGANASMTNLMYVSSARESGRLSLNGQAKAPDPRPKTDNLFVHNSQYQTGKLTLKLNYQDVGKDFSGFTTLRQQKVTADDILNQLEKERGFQRLGFSAGYSLGSNGSTGLNWSHVRDATGFVSRQSLSFGNDRTKINMDVQSVSQGFKSFKSLTAAEQAALGNEAGMNRMNLLGDFTLNGGLNLKTSFSQVHAKDAGLSKYGLSLTGKQFSVSANYQDIDPNFSRIMDLSDADKKTMAAEQGMKRYDLTTHYQASQSLTIDSFFYDAKHSTTGTFRKQFRNNIVIAPSRGPKLSILEDQVSTGNPSASTDTTHQQFRVEQQMGFMSFNAVHDSLAVNNSTGADSLVTTNTMHFDTDAKRRGSLIGDWKNIRQADGKFEDTKNLKLSYKLNPSLDFTANRLMILTDKNSTVAEDYNLTGKVFRNIGLKSRFAGTSVDGAAASQTRELSLVPDAAKDYGPFKQFKWSAGFSETDTPGKVVAQSKTAHVETNVMQHQVTMDYAGGITKDGLHPITRSCSIAGNPNLKLPLHYNLMYKSVDSGSGRPMLMRRYDAEWQINAGMKLSYNYFSYNVRPDGKIDPIGGEKLRLTTPVGKQLGLIGQWESTEDFANRIRRRTISLGLNGKLNDKTTFEGSYGFDSVITPSGPTTSWTYKMKYDCQMDADHFLTLSGKYTNWSGPKPANNTEDDVTVQLDLRSVFD